MKIIAKDTYIEVYADEGMVLTFYDDSSDIDAYDGFSQAYVKDELTVSRIREITLAQHREYMRQKESEKSTEGPE